MRWSVLLPVKPGSGPFESASLHRVLSSWALQHSSPDHTVEVLVLNRTSHDLSGLVPTTGNHVRVVDVPDSGPASALNRGLAEAIGDHLFFAQEENIAHPGLLGAHAERHHRAAMVYAREKRLLDWRTDPLVSRFPSTWIATDLEKLDSRSVIGDRELAAEGELASKGMAPSVAWMLVREGRTSVRRTLCDEVGAFDRNLDPDGWYLTEDYTKRLHALAPTFAMQVTAPLVHLPSRTSTPWPRGADRRAGELAQKHGDPAFTLFDQYFREKLTPAELSRRAHALS